MLTGNGFVITSVNFCCGFVYLVFVCCFVRCMLGLVLVLVCVVWVVWVVDLVAWLVSRLFFLHVMLEAVRDDGVCGVGVQGTSLRMLHVYTHKTGNAMALFFLSLISITIAGAVSLVWVVWGALISWLFFSFPYCFFP